MHPQPDPAPSLAAECGCDACHSDELPFNPRQALRVAYGMLLGEDDFRTAIGYPRGKQMLHHSWLHGRGVVWGYPVRTVGTHELEVGPGLALDGLGREVLHEATHRLDVRGLLELADSSAEPVVKSAGVSDGCRTVTLNACVVAEFITCLASPVPTLADPCDVTREHDDWSRVNERARIRLVPGSFPASAQGWHRVRVLLGLEQARPDDPAGEEALEARSRAGKAPRPAQALLHEFRRMACLDSMDVRPMCEPGEEFPHLFPADEEHTAVIIAGVSVTARERDGCWEVVDAPRTDPCLRTTLLPTAAIAELACGDAPALVSWGGTVDAGGPRVIGEDIRFEHGGLRLVVPVTRELVPGSVQDSVGITSLAPGPHERWVVEDIYDACWDKDARAIVVTLSDPPAKELVRIVVRGTGGRPVLGREPLAPLAGLVGGPPGTRHEGHDAVWILTVPAHTYETAPDDQPGSPDQAVASEQTEAGA